MELDLDPIVELQSWLRQARDLDLPVPDAMTLATVHEDGGPDARMVLLRGVAAAGLSFYTNYDSRKSQQLEANSRAGLLLHWPQLRKQIRVRGIVVRSPSQQSDIYWKTRPRESQIAAYASAQSESISGRDVLEERFGDIGEIWGDQEIPRPQHWGGFTLEPDEFEFWIGRDSRLHDRIRYTRDGENWARERLAP